LGGAAANDRTTRAKDTPSLAKRGRDALNVTKLGKLVAGLLLAGLIGGSAIRAAEPASIVLGIRLYRFVRRDAGSNA
jgi:hypothetical protein